MAAGITLTLTPKDLDKTGRRLAAVVAATARPGVLMQRIAAVLESSTRVRFRTNLAPDGTAWKPSARARARGGRTLMLSGRLRDSITSRADEHSAEVGTNVIYAAIHQLGGDITAKAGGALTFNIPGVGWRRVAKVSIPARPFLGVSRDDRVEIADQVERWLRKAAA